MFDGPWDSVRDQVSLFIEPFRKLRALFTLTIERHSIHSCKENIYLFLERGEGREKERERNIDWLPLACMPLTGDLAPDPGMCPDQELNL